MRRLRAASTRATSAVEMRNALAVLRTSLHLSPLAPSDDLSFLADSAVNPRTSWIQASCRTLARKLHRYF